MRNGSSDPGPSICFVAHNAYGALAGVDTGHIGGIERQQALMARALAARGFRVSMITHDEGQPDGVVIDGVRVFRLCGRRAGLRFVRFVYPRWTSLCRALRRADSDVYYYNCGDLGLAQLVSWCRRHGRRAVYSVASDADCERRLPLLGPWRERVLYRWGLRHADRVIAQTLRQQRMLRENFGVNAVVVPMLCAAAPAEAARRPPAAGEPVRILWVGRFSPEKRLEWLLDLAERCPQWHFDVVGAANAPTPYARKLTDRAARLPNVTCHGRVAHERLGSFYRSAAVLCCTSACEGFPNTFLEAWSHGLPIVSTFDPDDLLAGRELGLAAATVPQLAAALACLLAAPDQWRRLSENARRYYRENHTLAAALPRFEAVFREVARFRHVHPVARRRGTALS